MPPALPAGSWRLRALASSPPLPVWSGSRGGRCRHRHGIGAAADGGAAIDGKYPAQYIQMYRNLCRRLGFTGFFERDAFRDGGSLPLRQQH